MSYSILWVTLGHLNLMFWRFGTLCISHLHRWCFGTLSVPPS